MKTPLHNARGTDNQAPLPADRPAGAVALRKPIAGLTPADRRLLLDRGQATDQAIVTATAGIIAAVRDRGDAALRELALRFDNCAPDALEVPPAACQAALATLDPDLRAALEDAATAIATFHRAQIPPPLEVEVAPGVRLGRRAEPLRTVGVYAPGGRASYPSSVLMGVIPARIAGVQEIVLCSPPGPDGLPPAPVLAACALAGADRVFAIGGAGAVAALALGTETVPRVDKIVGPGNAFVTEAKSQLTGAVATDCPAGPSEILVIADDAADPELAALELIAQAEHDPLAKVVVVTLGSAQADAIADAIRRLATLQPRREIIEAALASGGAILTADSLDEAIAFAELYAPEHLLLLLNEPRAALERVRAAGTIFLGAPSSVAFGDYTSGANHVLPTGGLARAYSGLSTLDFLRFATYQELSPAAAARLAPTTARLADAEGLPGHAAAARARAVGDLRDIIYPDNIVANPGINVAPQIAVAPGPETTSANSTAAAPETTPSPETAPAPGTGANLPAPRLRNAYRDLEPYHPGREPVEVDLSDNTNLFGANPAVQEAVAALGTAHLTRYPEVSAASLREEIAALHGVAPENITTGCGLDDVIDSTIRAFCDPGDTIAYPDPTFGMVALFARMNDVATRPVPLPPDLRLDPEVLLAARGHLTYICNPNNPTGTLWELAAIERVAAETDGILLIDQAYADFASTGTDADTDTDTGPTPVSEPRIGISDRTLTLRTLSKAYGLAGLRIGYAIGPAELIREVEKSRGPYKITAAADIAARASLRAGRGWVREVVAETIRNRERLRAALQYMGIHPLPSATNFLLIPLAPGGHKCGHYSALALADELRRRGVAVRAFPGLFGIGDAIRVTIGPWPLMQRFLDTLAGVLGPDAYDGGRQ